MKRLLLILAMLVATTISSVAATLNRTYLGCELGATTQQVATDTIKEQYRKDGLIPKVDGCNVVANKIRLYGYQFDEAELQFSNDKLKSITLTRVFFDLVQADSFLKEAAPYFVGEDCTQNNEGLISERDGSTYIRLALIQTDDGSAKVEVFITDLIRN